MVWFVNEKTNSRDMQYLHLPTWTSFHTQRTATLLRVYIIAPIIMLFVIPWSRCIDSEERQRTIWTGNVIIFSLIWFCAVIHELIWSYLLWTRVKRLLQKSIEGRSQRYRPVKKSFQSFESIQLRSHGNPKLHGEGHLIVSYLPQPMMGAG